ncbi:MAG: dihydrofolate reductase family protein [Solirubrobacterales bacterium]
MQRLIPDPGATTIEEQMAGFDPVAAAGSERPHVFTNFAVTVDGHATISGRSGEIGTGTDTAMLMALRASAEAVMVGAGTLRAESYGRLLPNSETRARRERRGLPPDPLAVVVSNRMELPWDAGLFTSGAGQVLVFTASEEDHPETATPMEVIRHQGGVDLVAAVKHLRTERGIRALLCEGGPHLHGDLLDAGVVDELFVTLGAKLAGGSGPRMAEGLDSGPLDVELRWLLQDGNELFARYAVKPPVGSETGT